MNQRNQSIREDRPTTIQIVMSRRAALGSSGMAVLGLLSGSAFGREVGKAPPPEVQERMEQARAFSERMRHASGPEEMRKIMAEQRAWYRARAVEELKDQLGLSDQEWPVVKPRIEAVYDLVHRQRQFGPGNAPPRTEVEQRTRELREILRDDEVGVDELKAKLTALRVAKEKARQELAAAQQNLLKLMTLRQEAQLVLHGLLD